MTFLTTLSVKIPPLLDEVNYESDSPVPIWLMAVLGAVAGAGLFFLLQYKNKNRNK